MLAIIFIKLDLKYDLDRDCLRRCMFFSLLDPSYKITPFRLMISGFSSFKGFIGWYGHASIQNYQCYISIDKSISTLLYAAIQIHHGR